MLDLLFPTVFQGPVQLIAAVGILFLAQVVYVVFGFGSGLIAVGTLALFLAMTFIRVPSYEVGGLITRTRL